MQTRQLLERLRQLEIVLWLEDDRLRCSAPSGALTAALRAEIVEHKAEIMKLLKKDMRHAAVAQPPFSSAPRDRPLPLSFAQQRLWFLNELDPESRVYYAQHAFSLKGPLRKEVVHRCWSELIRRHESLRATFQLEQGTPVQIVQAPFSPPLPVIDLGTLSHEEQLVAIEQCGLQIKLQRYDLARGPLLRLALLKLAADNHILLVAMHHIISDGWSTGILMRDMSTLYQSYSRGEGSPLPELRFQYVDYACWQRAWLQGTVLEEHLAYWRAQCSTLPPSLELPTDLPRPAQPSYRGAMQMFELSASVVARLKTLGQRENVTLYMLLLAAFQVVLARYTGLEDIALFAPIANRTRAETTEIVGFFVNSLILRTDLSGNPSWRTLLKRVREVTLEAYTHQHLPFEKLVEVLRPRNSLNLQPFTQISFDFHNAPQQPLRFPGVVIAPYNTSERKFIDFDLAVEISEEESGGLIVAFYYSTDLFYAKTIQRLLQRYHLILASLLRDQKEHVFEIDILTEEERLRLLSPAQEDLSPALPFSLSWQRQVIRVPESVAVVSEEQALTYAALDRRAERLANELQRRGVSAEERVGLLARRGIPWLIAILAIFKAGGVYVPLDESYPARRIATIVEQGWITLALTEEAFLPALKEARTHLPAQFPLDEIVLEAAIDDAVPNGVVSSQVEPENLAYIIFTSGSTGLPKGVMIEQRGMVNHLHAKIEDLGLTEHDRVAQTASSCFDISVWQLLSGLLVGGCVHIFANDVVRRPKQLLAQWEQAGITIAEIVPVLLQGLLAGPPGPVLSLRWLLLTGETLHPELCRAWFTRYPAIPLLNAYGPTECSDDVTHAVIKEPPASSTTRIPIGRAVANMHLYVLDRYLRPVPPGGIGELYVAGVGVGRGYLSDPEQTAASFIPHPFAAKNGARLYKTGDKARWLADGTLEFWGRADGQIKLHGFRIELAEIEETLLSHPAIGNAVVLLQEDQRGVKQLVAYIVPIRQQPIDPYDIRAFLHESLPDYMLPSLYIPLDALPTTAQGKIDRAALSLSGQILISQRDYVEPRNETEAFLAQLWSELLQVERVGIHDNFFALGGHSLLATQAVSRINERLECDIALRVIFETSTLAELAVAITKKRDKKRPERPESVSEFLAGIDQFSEEELLSRIDQFSEEDRALLESILADLSEE